MKKKMQIFCKKELVFLIGLLLIMGIFLCLRMRQVQAYLSDEDELINTMNVGKNEIIVEEKFEQPLKEKKTVKEPCVKNTGTVDCFVRARVVVSDSRATDYFNYYYGEKEGWNEENWMEGEDGWFYYDGILAVGDCTAPIFTHIKLSSNLPDALADFTIDVLAESVQAVNFMDAVRAFEALGSGGGKR